MRYLARLAAAALFCLVSVACSDEEHAPTATPGTTTPIPGTAATGRAEGEQGSIPVTWEPVGDPAFTTVTVEDPDVHTDNLRRRFGDVPDDRFVWHVFAAALEGEPRLVHESPSNVWGASWVANDTHVAITQAGPRMTLLDASATGGTAPQRVDYQPPFYIAPDGNTAAFVTGARELVVVDLRTRAATRLRGLPGQLDIGSIRGWSSDGALVLVRTPVPGRGDGWTAEWFAVPTADGEAKRVGVGRPPGPTESTAWSSEGRPLLALLDDTGAMSLFDAATGTTSELAAQGSFTRVGRLSWSKDGQRIQVGDQFIDVDTGKMGAYRLPQEARVGFAVSPDERQVVAASMPSAGPPIPTGDCAFPPRQNRVVAIDQATGAARVLKDCDERFFVSFQWVGDTGHVLMSGGNCYQCEAAQSRVSLLDAASGEETRLTDGLEFMARRVISPDHQKILVTGDRLRVYSTDGRLVQQIEPPAGFSVTEAAWSADSTRFVYVLGPTGVWSI